jgi:hypothetical protein
MISALDDLDDRASTTSSFSFFCSIVPQARSYWRAS